MLQLMLVICSVADSHYLLPGPSPILGHNQIILFGDRGTMVQQCPTSSRNSDLQIASPTAYSLHHHDIPCKFHQNPLTLCIGFRIFPHRQWGQLRGSSFALQPLSQCWLN